jgi:hypothetical protein
MRSGYYWSHAAATPSACRTTTLLSFLRLRLLLQDFRNGHARSSALADTPRHWSAYHGLSIFSPWSSNLGWSLARVAIFIRTSAAPASSAARMSSVTKNRR